MVAALERALPAMTLDAAAPQMFSLEVFAKLLERSPGLPALLQLFGLASPVIAWAALSGDRGLCWLFAFVRRARTFGGLGVRSRDFVGSFAFAVLVQLGNRIGQVAHCSVSAL